MIVVTTSCAPETALRKPGMKPARAPARAPASKASGMAIHGPVEPPIAEITATEAMEPIRNWPRPPMLNSPALKPTATPRPPRISGAE